MRRQAGSARAVLAVVFLVLAATSCGTSKPSALTGTGGSGVGGNGGATATSGLEKPADLLRAPNGVLPAELLPPGFHR